MSWTERITDSGSGVEKTAEIRAVWFGIFRKFRYEDIYMLRLLLLICVLWAGFTARGAEITTAKAVLELSPDSAEQGHSVLVKGVVTCSDAKGVLCFVQDETAGVYVFTGEPLPEIGDIVQVKGVSKKGRFSPIILAESIEVQGKGPLPKPTPMAVEQMASGRYDSQWVEVEGVVLRQVENWGQILLSLGSGNSRLDVRILKGDPAAQPNLVDARIKIRGVAGTTYNDRGQLTGFHLLTQNTNLIEVVEAAPSDPYAVELRQSRNMMAFSRQGASEHRMRLRGVVTFYWPGRDFFIRDESGGVRVQSSETTPLQAGDIVDVVGFPSAGLLRPVMTEAIYRRVGSGSEPAAKAISTTEALNGEFESELVSIEGKVLQIDEVHAGFAAIALEANQKIFRVCFQNDWKITDREMIGGVVRVTGICTADSAKEVSGENFSIWMRRPADLQVIARSPVWKQRQMLYALSGLGGAVFFGAAWVILLRKRVRQQTEVIRKREAALEDRYRDLFENANDIIYAHDLNGRITSMSNSGQAALGYTLGELTRMNIADIVEPEDLEKARQNIKAKVSGAGRTAYELRLRSKNGQRLTFEINSRLIFKEGAPLGVEGIAKDITARKKAEEALRLSERQLRASLDERERLGRDLHDGIIQSIYAAGLNLDDCSRIVTADPTGVEKRLRKTVGDLNRVIRDVRDFIMGLERHRLKGDEFKGALKSLALTVGESQSTRIELAVDEQAASGLTSIQSTQLLHVAREALSNAIRHARAQKVTFHLHRTEAGVAFEVVDDGVGFNPSVCVGKGFGLRNMEARAREIRATFQVVSQIGEGARIVLDIPIGTSEQLPRENPLAYR